MSHVEVRSNAAQTPCPIKAKGTSRSTSKSEDTETKNNGKYGIVAAGTPLPLPPKATPAIDSTPPNKTTKPSEGLETPIPETPLQNTEQETPIPETPPQSTEQQTTEENNTRLTELLKLLETATEELSKANNKQVNTIIENAKASIKKATTITQKLIFEKEHENQLSHITKELSELKNLVMRSKTYADTAATRTHREPTPDQETSPNRRNPHAPSPEDNHTREIQQRNFQRKVQQRHEKNKLEVVLTTQEMDPDTKKQIAQQSHAEITTKLQQNVESQMKNNPPIIQGIEKLKSQNIRIHSSTEEEAEQLRKLNWDKAYNGLTVHQPKYGIMIPGVPKELINPNELMNPELARQLEHQNKGKGARIIEIKTLRRKLKNTSYYSLVIFFDNPESADQCIKQGFYMYHQRFSPEKYNPQFQLIQCYKCQKFGHHATKCRNLHEVCAKCSEHHSTSQCHSEIHKCAGCKGEHPAWHQDCPIKINAIQNLTTRKREAPSYFNE
jgi:hypothetical protein